MDGMTEQVVNPGEVDSVIQDWRTAAIAIAISIYNEAFENIACGREITESQRASLADMVNAEISAVETDQDRRDIDAMFFARDRGTYIRFKRRFLERHIPPALERAIASVLGWELPSRKVFLM